MALLLHLLSALFIFYALLKRISKHYFQITGYSAELIRFSISSSTAGIFRHKLYLRPLLVVKQFSWQYTLKNNFLFFVFFFHFVSAVWRKRVWNKVLSTSAFKHSNCQIFQHHVQLCPSTCLTCRDPCQAGPEFTQMLTHTDPESTGTMNHMWWNGGNYFHLLFCSPKVIDLVDLLTVSAGLPWTSKAPGQGQACDLAAQRT